MSAHVESIRYFIDAWKLMAGRLPGSTISHENGLANCFGNTPLSFLNISLFDHPLTDLASLDQGLGRAIAEAESCPYAWLHALCTDELPAGWEETVSAHSMAAIMNLTGMAADQFLEPIRPLPTLDWRRVTDIKTATDLAHLNAHAYGMPAELFDAVCNMHIWQDDCVAMVGYLDDQPVTSSAALPVAGTIYIALVASHADHRGKGYAEACIREVVEAAKQIMSSEKITLHASDAGRPLYAQMGFEASTTFALLTLVNPEAEAH